MLLDQTLAKHSFIRIRVAEYCKLYGFHKMEKLKQNNFTFYKFALKKYQLTQINRIKERNE